MPDLQDDIRQQEDLVARESREFVDRPTASLKERRAAWPYVIFHALVCKILNAINPSNSIEKRAFALREILRSTQNEVILTLCHLLEKLADPKREPSDQIPLVRQCLHQLDEQLAKAEPGPLEPKADPSHKPLRRGQPSHGSAEMGPIPTIKLELLASLMRARDSSARIRVAPPGATEREIVGPILLQMPDIIGIGFGAKLVNGIIAGEAPVLRVYMRAKKPRHALDSCELIPAAVNGVSTDVIAVGEISPLSAVKCGTSISAESGTSGTIGCLVEKLDDPSRRFILSCSHVMADSPKTKKGDSIFAPSVRRVLGRATAIARLEDWTRLESQPLVDAAIAELTDRAAVMSQIEAIGQIASGATEPDLYESVRKCGSTTGHTVGVIEDVSATMRIDYRPPLPHGVVFAGLIVIRGVGLQCFSDYGDSGALLLDAVKRTPVGLVFAGGGGTGLAHRLGPVLNQFGVRVVTV